MSEGAAAPTVDEVRSYYDSRPALFRERRIYNLQELAVETTPEQRAEVEGQLKALKSPAELEAYIKAKQLRVRADRSTMPAENIPLPLVEKLASMKPGSGLVLPAVNGVRVVLVNSTQDAPVTIEQARPAIEAFLLNERKRVVLDKELKSLRASATVEYFGKFRDLPASAAAAAASASEAAAAALPPATAASAGDAMDATTTLKGLSGLK